MTGERCLFWVQSLLGSGHLRRALTLAGALAGASQESSATVSLRSTNLGRILVSAKGHTLYLFLKDRNAKSAASIWWGLRSTCASDSTEASFSTLSEAQRRVRSCAKYFAWQAVMSMQYLIFVELRSQKTCLPTATNGNCQ